MNWLKEWRSARAADQMVVRAKNRADNLSALELSNWLEATIVGMTDELDSWRHTDDPVLRLDAISDGVVSAEVVLVLISELRDRQKARVERRGTKQV